MGDVSVNHVGVDVGSPAYVTVANVYALNLGLNSEVKLEAWVDYDVGWQTLEG
jgi:hypothetical protein